MKIESAKIKLCSSSTKIQRCATSSIDLCYGKTYEDPNNMSIEIPYFSGNVLQGDITADGMTAVTRGRESTFYDCEITFSKTKTINYKISCGSSVSNIYSAQGYIKRDGTDKVTLDFSGSTTVSDDTFSETLSAGTYIFSWQLWLYDMPAPQQLVYNFEIDFGS